VAQIDRLDLPVADRRGGWLPRLCRQLDDPTVAVAGLIRALHTFRPLLRLIPPPGRSECDLHVRVGDGGNGPRDGRHVTDPVLQRVRALLAKAEATTYPAEAEAFTAKAHELMTRHAIDAALVARAGRRGQCGAIRIPIDEPYLDAKVLLLHTLSEHSRCRSISHGALALCTVVGDPDDLFAVQLLFTSLLLQAQQAVLAESTGTDAGAHRRSRAFRSSFLRAYAVRIGERLADVGAEVAADVERSTGTEVLPVLVERRRIVDDAVEQLFGDVRPVRSRGGQDAAGWHRGRQAADRARLSSTDLPPAPPGRGALPAGALDTAS
jgi:hypothetical protein